MSFTGGTPFVGSKEGFAPPTDTGYDIRALRPQKGYVGTFCNQEWEASQWV